MSGCGECIAYKLHHNIIEPLICDECGHKTLVWKQDKGGTFYLECTNCLLLVGVDLNTPCEQDPLFWQKTEIYIEPQKNKLSKQVIHDTAKFFHINSLQMREQLLNGTSVDLDVFDADELMDLLQRQGIIYRVIDPKNPRQIYSYYKECRYPYSPMRKYL